MKNRLAGLLCTFLIAGSTVAFASAVDTVPASQKQGGESAYEISVHKDAESDMVVERHTEPVTGAKTETKVKPRYNTAVYNNNIENEPSSIDMIDKGVADTGETNFSNTDKELVECTTPYTVAVLPYVDVSGLEGRSREMAVGAVKDALKVKYPGKKKSVNRIVSNNALQQAMVAYPMENPEVPTLAELVAVGEACGADRVLFISLLPVREKETGFMVIAGTQTYSATVTMKLKCVDVNEEKFLYNQNVEGIGSSSSINFWKIGQPSHAKAVKRGVTECMRNFLTSFE